MQRQISRIDPATPRGWSRVETASNQKVQFAHGRRDDIEVTVIDQGDGTLTVVGKRGTDDLGFYRTVGKVTLAEQYATAGMVVLEDPAAVITRPEAVGEMITDAADVDA